jgi:hypothetical protein
VVKKLLSFPSKRLGVPERVGIVDALEFYPHIIRDRLGSAVVFDPVSHRPAS